MILDIIANIKIDETKSNRTKMLLASIRSFRYFSKECKWFIYLEDCSMQLKQLVLQELHAGNFRFHLFHKGGTDNYGQNYTYLLSLGKAPFVLNFIEDHFSILDDAGYLFILFYYMKRTAPHVICKTTFWNIETESGKHVLNKDISKHGTGCIIYQNNEVAHQEYQLSPFGQRYYIGVNFLTDRPFAEMFWKRSFSGKTPYPFEVPSYQPDLEHTTLIPGREFLCSIDDPHGDPGSNLLSRPNEKKFWDIYNSIDI